MDLALNNLQRLICHKTQPTNPSNMHNVNGSFVISTYLWALGAVRPSLRFLVGSKTKRGKMKNQIYLDKANNN